MIVGNVIQIQKKEKVVQGLCWMRRGKCYILSDMICGGNDGYITFREQDIVRICILKIDK